MNVTVLPDGKVRITHNLASITVTRGEAEHAATNPNAAARLVHRLTTLRRGGQRMT